MSRQLFASKMPDGVNIQQVEAAIKLLQVEAGHLHALFQGARVYL